MCALHRVCGHTGSSFFHAVLCVLVAICPEVQFFCERLEVGCVPNAASVGVWDDGGDECGEGARSGRVGVRGARRRGVSGTNAGAGEVAAMCGAGGEGCGAGAEGQAGGGGPICCCEHD